MRCLKALALLTGLAAAAPAPAPAPASAPQAADNTLDPDILSVVANSSFTLVQAPSDRSITVPDRDYVGDGGLVDMTVPDYNLPDNIPQDFWTAKYPPSKLVKKADALPFEVLHCDGTWDDKENRVSGTCHYLAGEVSRHSELIIAMAGTRSMVANCDLRGKMAVGWRPWKWFWPDYRTTTLSNGLCYYDNQMNMDYIRITN